MSQAAQKLVKLSKKDLETDQDVRWCPGCGDYAILATVQRTLANLGIKRRRRCSSAASAARAGSRTT
jgi:pyruvate/2-oxoacid:ferredoxin oxidoreductase beta subunit